MVRKEGKGPLGNSIELIRAPVTAEEMRSIEDRGVALGISRLVMMENAGHSIADEVKRILTPKLTQQGKSQVRVAFIAGTGNNGGDAFVAARHLTYWGTRKMTIELFLVGLEEDIRAEEALVNWKILKKQEERIRIHVIDTERKIRFLKEKLHEVDLMVVGIFGTGFHGEPRSIQKSAIEEVNENSRAKILSIDIPSGMEADTGNAKVAVRSDVTVTMHAPKVGMLVNEKARKMCGRIVVANIGLPW
jgi:hydroxyethylthiazole kinase-like uncharacterized protein yjeF